MPRRRRNVLSKALLWLHAHCGEARPDQCLIMPFASGSHGYCSFSIKQRKTLAHRYVCKRFHGPAPSSDHQAAHSCGIRNCVNPHHLRWATRKENASDMLGHGTVLLGIRNPSAKLTPAAVEMIRASALSHRKLALMHGVSSSTIGRVKSGESWGNHA